MKKNNLIRSFILLSSFILCSNYSVFAQCKLKSVIQNCQGHIKPPYKYNGYWTSDFTFDTKAKKIEGHFVAFEGEKYHILFCNSGFDEEVNICVYDKSNRLGGKERIKYYESTVNKEKDYWTFEPTRSGDYYIEYSIPPSKNGEIKKSCVVLLIGAIIDTDGN